MIVNNYLNKHLAQILIAESDQRNIQTNSQTSHELESTDNLDQPKQY